jgi:predicted DNA-binding protein
MKPRPDNLTFRINPDTKAKLKQLAAADERTLSQLVSIIVERYVNEAFDDAAGNDPAGDKSAPRRKAIEAPAKKG